MKGGLSIGASRYHIDNGFFVRLKTLCYPYAARITPPKRAGPLRSLGNGRHPVRPERVEGRVSVLVRQAHHERKPRT